MFAATISRTVNSRWFLRAVTAQAKALVLRVWFATPRAMDSALRRFHVPGGPMPPEPALSRAQPVRSYTAQPLQTDSVLTRFSAPTARVRPGSRATPPPTCAPGAASRTRVRAGLPAPAVDFAQVLKATVRQAPISWCLRMESVPALAAPPASKAVPREMCVERAAAQPASAQNRWLDSLR